MINILLLCLWLVISSSYHRVDGVQSTIIEDLELEAQLKLINKIPVKSIHTKFGHIVDCIDIKKQPAFDHPLLKNHKLQIKPSLQQTTAKTTVNNSPAKHIIGLEKDLCPTGTVPIQRTTKDDLIRAKTFSNTHILTQDSPGVHVAHVSLVKVPGSAYYGVSGINSVYNPKVEKDQTTASHLWVQNGQTDGTNKIMVGWHVSPQLHGDMATYIYSYWTSDNFKKTGCYNVQCSGFIQTDKQVYLGARVDNTSIYGGLMIEMQISLSQDPETKNWWLNMENKTIGYFPAALFSNMATADQVGWGGRTTTTVGSASPPMGSGYFPDNNFIHACYFRHVTFQNESRQDYGPEEYRVQPFTDRPDCFGVTYNGYLAGGPGYALQFGGPGGNCGD